MKRTLISLFFVATSASAMASTSPTGTDTFGGYRAQDMGQYNEQMNHENRYGAAVAASAERVQNDTNRAYGQSYLDAKNEVSGTYTKNDPTGSPISQGSVVSGTSYRSYVNQLQQSATINVAASSLKPDAKVNVTVSGITSTVTASSLAPTTQVSIQHVPAFERNPGKGSSNDQGASHTVGSTSNGANNAANTNSAHGLGGGAHIGGGSAMGGGFHGNW